MSEINNINSAQKAERMKLIQQQIALANTQTLLTKMTEKCFQKCIYKPGSSLDSSEQKCVAMCMDRFMDSWNLVSRTLANHIYRENSDLS